MVVRLIVLALLLQGGQAGSAPSLPSPQAAPKNPLFTARQLSCSFGVYATAIWKETTPEVVSRTQDFSFKIDSIDAKKGQARIVSGNASAIVSMIVTQTGINLVEKTRIGNLNVTTIFVAGGHDDVFIAVHSRHLGDLTAAPSVSQNYGTCQASQ
ncbi:MAG TPA: hypothetical protein VLT86_03560 [Vicinamibacterales bacterium]|nr:hypothetical protein [Vicinamibacterales bacterium]